MTELLHSDTAKAIYERAVENDCKVFIEALNDKITQYASSGDKSLSIDLACTGEQAQYLVPLLRRRGYDTDARYVQNGIYSDGYYEFKVKW